MGLCSGRDALASVQMVDGRQSMGLKRPAYPCHSARLDGDNIKSTGWRAGKARQVKPSRKNNAPLLCVAYACACTPMARRCAFPDLYKRRRAVRLAHNQINFTATAAWRSIIALNQTQSGAK